VQQIELVEGGAHNRNKFIEVNSILDMDYYGKSGTDCYTSIYLHSTKILEYLKEHKQSSSGYSGIVKAEFLHFDFDSSDLSESQKDTIALIQLLCSSYETDTSQFRIWFTGNKGFHLFLLFPGLKESIDIPKRMRAVCKSLAGNLKTFDPIPYDCTRIWRIPNSKHGKTGLFAIPLSWVELSTLTPDQIKELAKTQRQVEAISLDQFLPNKELINFFYTIETSATSEIRITDGVLNGFKEGQRNMGLTSIAGLLRAKGFEYSFIRAALLSFNGYHKMGLDETEVNNIAKSVQRYKPDNRPSDISDIKHMSQCQNEWLVQKKERSVTHFGIPSLGRSCGSFSRSEVLNIAARAGVGKTTMAMTLLQNISKIEKKYCLFFSLEMSGAELFQRAGIAYLSKTFEGENCVDENNEDWMKNKIKKIADNATDITRCYEKILCLDRAKVSLENMVEYYNKAVAEYGDIDLVAIDYLGYIYDCQSKSTYEKISNIARGVKEFAKDTNTRVILLTQANRAAQDGNEPIKLHHLRDSGAVEESADYVVGMWDAQTPGEKRICCEVLKTRWFVKGMRFDLLNQGLLLTETPVIDLPKNTFKPPKKEMQ